MSYRHSTQGSTLPQYRPDPSISLPILSPMPFPATGTSPQFRHARPTKTKNFSFRQRHMPVISQFEHILTALENGGQFDFTQSRHKSGLKVGGLMRKRSKDLNIYASFRNHRGECAEISLMQVSDISKPYLVVRQYRVRPGLPGIKRRYEFADLHAAFDDYGRSIKAIH